MTATPLPRLPMQLSSGRSVRQLLAASEQAATGGLPWSPKVWRTGFSPLDACLGGGLRAGELTLVAGAPSVGKTAFALQLARNAARRGAPVIYACYEHPEEVLLERLIALEAGLLAADCPLEVSAVRNALATPEPTPGGLAGLLPEAGPALDEMAAYGDRLRLLRADRSVGLGELRQLVLDPAGSTPLLVVDYLQKVPSDSSDDEVRASNAVEGLKDLALEANIPVVALVASDKGGLGGARTRLSHLRGSTALAYEADVALLFNDKFSIVARHHLVYGTVNPERFRDWVVVSIEKNRGGRDHVDLEFRKEFAQSRFDPRGQYVSEQLVDDRLNLE